MELSKDFSRTIFYSFLQRFAACAGVIFKVYHLRPIRWLIVSGLDRLSASLAFPEMEDRKREKDEEKERRKRACEIYSPSAFVTSKAEWQVRCIRPVSCLCSHKFNQFHDQYFHLDNSFQKSFLFRKSIYAPEKVSFQKKRFSCQKKSLNTFVTESMRFYM